MARDPKIESGTNRKRSIGPLSVEEALKGAMETGKLPEPENKRARWTVTKRRVTKKVRELHDQ